MPKLGNVVVGSEASGRSLKETDCGSEFGHAWPFQEATHGLLLHGIGTMKPEEQD